MTVTEKGGGGGEGGSQELSPGGRYWLWSSTCSHTERVIPGGAYVCVVGGEGEGQGRGQGQEQEQGQEQKLTSWSA